VKKSHKSRVVTTTPEEFGKTFLAVAEGALSMGDQADMAMKRGKCSQAVRHAMEMSEEVGSLRGIMASLSEEAAFEKGGKRKSMLEKLLSSTQDDYEMIVERRSEVVSSLGRSCRFASGEQMNVPSIPGSAFPTDRFYEQED
jgi:hypothetical protein